MAEFVKIEYFAGINVKDGAGKKTIVPSEQPIERQDIAQIQKHYGKFFPFYCQHISDIPQEISSRGQLQTGTYIISDSESGPDNGNCTGIIFTIAKQEGNGASTIYYNEGVSILDHTKEEKDNWFALAIIASYYPPWRAIFVKDKRIKVMLMKHGQSLCTPSSLWVKQNGALKRIKGRTF